MSAWRRGIWIAGGGVWLAGAAAGLSLLMDYDNRPGVAAHAPPAWPAESALVRDHERPTLVMLAHPRCDCTRASVGELTELVARARQQPRVFVVFIKPGGVDTAWKQTELWAAAARIPGATIVRDDLGAEARRFGVETSGQTVLYDAGGRLLFAGGATGARGRAGDNAGRATLLALLNGEQPASTSTPVFGCPLFGPADHPRDGEGHAHGATSN